MPYSLFLSLVTPLEASYVFAAAKEANYLSRFIEARISYINHIPLELLGEFHTLLLCSLVYIGAVGPFAPKHPSIAPNSSPRYCPAIFRSPKPRVNRPSHLTNLYNEMKLPRSNKELDILTSFLLKSPLPALNQQDGKVSGFFDQAFMAVGIISLSVVAASVVGLFWFKKRN